MIVQAPPLTRLIGETERTLQELLRRQLAHAGQRFPEWVVLTLLAPNGTLPRTVLLDGLAHARVVAEGGEQEVIDAMAAAGHLDGSSDLTITEAGQALFQPLRKAVGGLVAEVTRDISPEDMETTRQVLAVVNSRALAQLNVQSPGARQSR